MHKVVFFKKNAGAGEAQWSSCTGPGFFPITNTAPHNYYSPSPRGCDALSDFLGQQAHMWFTHICRQNMSKHKKNKQNITIITIIMMKLRLQRQLSGSELLLLMQRSWFWFSAPTWWLTTLCNASPEDLTLSFGLHGDCTQMIHRLTCRQIIQTHKIQYFFKQRLKQAKTKALSHYYASIRLAEKKEGFAPYEKLKWIIIV